MNNIIGAPINFQERHNVLNNDRLSEKKNTCAFLFLKELCNKINFHVKCY